MTIQEKFEKLTPEQRQKLQTVKTEQELNAFLAEAGIEPTEEERAELYKHLKPQNATRELSDDEVEEAAGGSGFKKCPYGHYEATGFANYVFGPSIDCCYGKPSSPKCEYYIYTVVEETEKKVTFRYFCSFFGSGVESCAWYI